jgi:hypothetical protein
VRELQQDGAELARGRQRREPRAHRALVLGARALLVRELLPELCGEEESRMGRHALDPLRRDSRPRRLVKRGIDLDRVEILRQVRGFVEIPRAPLRIEDSVPVRVGPARGPDDNPVRLRRRIGILLHEAAPCNLLRRL